MASGKRRRSLGLTQPQTEMREPKRRFFIVTEGQTEETYLKHLHEVMALKRSAIHVVFEVVSSKEGTDPKSVVHSMTKFLEDKKDKDELRSGDFAWIVVDEDEGVDSHFDVVQEWVAERRDRFFGFSKPQFEYWLCLHHDKVVGVASQEACLRKLKWFVPQYKKNDARYLCSFGEEEIRRAVSNAADLHPQVSLDSNVTDLRKSSGAVDEPSLTCETIDPIAWGFLSFRASSHL